MKSRLAILSTHPIQYNAPFFRLLASDENIELRVFYSRANSEVRYDPEFRQEVVWDIPLTSGYSCNSFQASSRRSKRHMIDAIQDFNPHAIIVYGWNFPGHFDVMRHFFLSTQIWFRGDSTVIDPMTLGRKLVRRLWLSWVYKHIHKALFVGKANKRYFQFSGVPEQKLKLLPHAVDVNFFQSNQATWQAEAKQIRRNLGISEKAKVFLFVGKLLPIKQPIQFYESFIAANQNNDQLDSHLVFVGDGELFSTLSEKAKPYSNVHLIGFVNQSKMPAYYRLGDCLCLPSRTETWGLAVNEFLASNGKELILSNRVGCAEEFSHFPQCRLIECDQNADWQKAIIESCRNGVADNSLSIYCNSNYTFHVSKNAIIQMIKSDSRLVQP